jgi:3-hydroxyacyl-[acyl-carrier-protein] dehydratase
MKRDEIKRILPHREPMLLLDEAELAGGVSVGSYTVRGDEFFLQGHFPGHPVVPGVILCEIMAQSACLLIERSGEDTTPYFTGLNNVRFKNKVFPGDKVVCKSELLRVKPPFYFVRSSGYVNDKLCVCGEFSFAVIKGE